MTEIVNLAERAVGLATGGVIAVSALAGGRSMERWLRGKAVVSLPMRWLGSMAAGMWLATMTFHALRPLGLFDLRGAALFVAGSALLGLRGGGARSLWREGRHFGHVLWRAGRRRPQWWLAPVVICGITLRCAILPPLAWDSLVYHLFKAGLWVQSAGLSQYDAPGSWRYYRFFEGGGEALWAWAMLPARSDVLVPLADVATWLLLGLAVYVLSREAGLGRGPAVAAATFVMTIPAVWLAVGSAYVDTLNHALVLVGVAYLWRFVRRGDPGLLALAGVGLGLSAGVKLTSVPLLGLLVVAPLLWRRRSGDPSWRGVLAATAGAVGLAVIVWAPWPLESMRCTGYPFSGQDLVVAGVRLGENPTAAWYRQLDVGRPYTWDDEWRALEATIATPGEASLGLWSVPLFLVLPIGLVRLGFRSWRHACLAAAIVAYSAAIYWSPAFAVIRLGWSSVNGRHFLTALVMAVLLAGLAFGRRLFMAWMWWASLWHLGTLGTHAWTNLELSVVAGLLAMAIPLGFVAASLVRRPWLVGVCVAGALLLVASEVRVRSRGYLWRKGHSMGFTARYWVRSALAVDDRREGYRIALTAGALQRSDHWLSYPMLGSRLQNSVFYVPFTRSGRIADEYEPDYASEADRDAWIARLRSARVDFVMCFWPPGPELEWMEDSPELFGRVEGRGSRFGLYRLMSSELPSPRQEGGVSTSQEGDSAASTASREAQRSGS